ncbi:MAG: AAA family ATPase [bacterium]
MAEAAQKVHVLNPFDHVRSLCQRIATKVGERVVGQEETVQCITAGLLLGGHVLMEGVPGVGKTLVARTLADAVHLRFARVQFTPDLMPSDILGTYVVQTGPQGQPILSLQQGPLFANIVLADEINRATPRTQSAMLEVMNDAQVTIDGVTHVLDQPFMLIATQNPSDFEGTFALPENQMDRFLMRISLGYPSVEQEVRILQDRPGQGALQALRPVIDAAGVRALQQQTDAVVVDESLRRYVVAIASATRASDELLLGLSTRGALALTQAARATALLRGRGFVIPEDILENLSAVCSHRVITRTALDGEGTGRVLEGIVKGIASPA